jgi:hypothetical protein
MQYEMSKPRLTKSLLNFLTQYGCMNEQLCTHLSYLLPPSGSLLVLWSEEHRIYANYGEAAQPKKWTNSRIDSDQSNHSRNQKTRHIN